MKEELYLDEKFKIEIITKEELNEVMTFQDKIISNMEHKEFFTPLTEEEFLMPILEKDNVYILKDNNKIIGLFVATCNAYEILKEYQLKNNNVLLLDSVMIDEEYRGKGLQRKILKFLYKRAKELNLNGIVATVHPDNIYSLRNFLLEDYKIINQLKVHYGIRNIVYKKVEL